MMNDEFDDTSPQNLTSSDVREIVLEGEDELELKKKKIYLTF